MVPQQQRRRRRRAALARTAERRLVVARGSGGFGFTIAGQRPCVVSAVASGGPAERAGLRAGDALLTVDGANVARAPHASVARLVAAAPDAISLSVAPRESPPTDTEDTEPDERARTRRRHPPPRRRPQMMHHPGCHAAPSTSGVNEILQNLSRAQLASNHIARLECRAVVGYLGTIETPQAAATAAPGNVRTAVRKLRQERRPAAPVLLSVLPNALFLRRPTGQVLAQYPRERIVHAGCGSEADRRFFGLVTSAESQEAEASHSCHVFAVDPRMAEHEAHVSRAREFQVACTRDPVAERCLEFPPSAEYVVGVIRGMYSLPAEASASPGLQQISKLAVKGDSPALGNFSRCNRAAFRIPRDRRPGRPDDDGPDFVANSPQPSNHSEVTTTSSNSDSGIGFHNDCRNIADRILVVDFARGPPVNAFVREPIRRPVGLVGCGFDADGSFLSNAFPVVDGFAGQGRPLNLDDVMLNANDLQPVRRVNDDGYDYNGRGGAVYDRVYSEGEGLYDAPGAAALEMYEERWGADGASLRSARSHEEPVRVKRHHLQASLDDMLVLRPRETKPENDHDNFVHPASVKCKVRKSIKPLNILSKTKNILSRRDRSCESRDRDAEDSRDARRRALSASCGEVCSAAATEDGLAGAASEPDLRDTQSEQSSPFRRWTTGSGAGSSYRHHDHRNMYNKQISEGSGVGGGGAAGGVARWSLGLEQLLADPAGAAAFAHFLSKEFAAENIRFWWSCEQYSNTEDPAKRAALAAEIWQRHLDEKAPEPVNVDATARRAAALRLYNEPAAPDLFHQAQKQIFNVMKFDSYPRFLRSGVHAECARADLCGLPPPYAPANSAQAADTPTKLKKSASNASERRRSGGASLLPWKLRAPSKDRNPPAPTPSQPPPTDVVKTRQWAGQCSLCRVALPDGATSVVGVDENVTVRQLVDRLLQRRNLACATYDVVLKDFNEGESPNLDLNAPSTVLGGREVTVERRVVLRIEVGGKCVAVRCGRTRRLRHVLRPVLARYAGAAPLLRRHHAHLHPDTATQDLEGARLQIIEISDSEEGSGVACIIVQRPDATNDATGDLPDNDTQSISVASTSSRSRDYSLTNGLTDTIGLPATNGLSVDCCSLGDENSLGSSNSTLGNSNSTLGNSNSTLGSSNNCLGNVNNGLGNSNNGLGNSNIGLGLSNGGIGNGSSSGAGGRVRAALRSGPPLHHHPPDFLENLRETQRQRLQGKPSPPPLPPKPPQRPPTVV